MNFQNFRIFLTFSCFPWFFSGLNFLLFRTSTVSFSRYFFLLFKLFKKNFLFFKISALLDCPFFFLVFGFLTWTWGLKGPKLLPDLMYFLCRVGAEFQDVQQVSIRPGHEPSGASHSTLRPENMHENMFLQVPAHPPDRFRKTRFFLLRRFLLRSWYFVRYRRRWICGLSVKQDWNW